MKKSHKTVIWILVAVAVAVTAVVLLFIHAVLSFFGYRNPVERFYEKRKTDVALEKKYPGHAFDVKATQGFGEYGFYFPIYATDENGIEFYVQWVDGEMEDHYHDEWNKTYYGKKLVEYQNDLRDRYFPKIPYVDTYEYDTDDMFDFYRGPFKEVFFESMEDAIEGSKSCAFNTDVTFEGIDLDTADDEELQRFAESLADSMMWLSEETGYYDIRINSFYYREADEYGTGFKTRDELAESIIKQVMVQRKIHSKQ